MDKVPPFGVCVSFAVLLAFAFCCFVAMPFMAVVAFGAFSVFVSLARVSYWITHGK